MQKDTIAQILSLETETYQEFAIASIVETAEVLKRMLDKANFDSGERKYSRNPVCNQGEGGPIFLAATAQFSAVLYTGLSPCGNRRKG